MTVTTGRRSCQRWAKGQQALAAARVVVVCAQGGLPRRCAAAAGAGVGLYLIDGDHVTLSKTCSEDTVHRGPISRTVKVNRAPPRAMTARNSSCKGCVPCCAHCTRQCRDPHPRWPRWVFWNCADSFARPVMCLSDHCLQAGPAPDSAASRWGSGASRRVLCGAAPSLAGGVSRLPDRRCQLRHGKGSWGRSLPWSVSAQGADGPCVYSGLSRGRWDNWSALTSRLPALGGFASTPRRPDQRLWLYRAVQKCRANDWVVDLRGKTKPQQSPNADCAAHHPAGFSPRYPALAHRDPRGDRLRGLACARGRRRPILATSLERPVSLSPGRNHPL